MTVTDPAAPAEAPERKPLRWVVRGGFALADQGLFAVTNFALNIVLARWLSADAYGTFALVYAILILVGLLHTGVFIEPMMIFGGGKYSRRLSFYTGRVIVGYSLASLTLSALFVLIGFVLEPFTSSLVREGFVGLAVASPPVLLLWVLRRSFYVLQQPQWAAAGGVAYAVFVMGALYVFNAAGDISIFTAFVAQGFGALVTSLLLVRKLRPQWRRNADDPSFSFLAGEHWRYGRWAMAASVMAWAPLNAYYVILAGALPLSEIALLKAAMNILMPVFHSASALSMLLLPRFSSYLTKKNVTAFVSTYRQSLLVFVGLGFGLAILIVPLRSQITELLYGGRYGQTSSLLPIVGLIAIPGGVAAVLRTILRALEMPNRVFWCDTAGAAVTLVAIPLPLAFGPAGGLWALLIATVAGTACLRIAFGDRWRDLVRSADRQPTLGET